MQPHDSTLDPSLAELREAALEIYPDGPFRAGYIAGLEAMHRDLVEREGTDYGVTD